MPGKTCPPVSLLPAKDVYGVTSRNGKNRTLRPIERRAGPELALFNLLVQPPAMAQSIVGKELIGWDMLELAFRVLVEAAHPDVADALIGQGGPPESNLSGRNL